MDRRPDAEEEDEGSQAPPSSECRGGTPPVPVERAVVQPPERR